MTTPPIDRLIDQSTQWTELSNGDAVGDMPYATHSGVWEFQGMKMNVFRLSNGQCVIDEESMVRFMEWLTNEGAR